MKRVVFFSLIVIVLCTACGAQNDNYGASSTVENFYTALVEQDRDRISTIVCADWEKDALREVDAFLGVKAEMKDFSCSVTDSTDDTAVVVCEGSIAATYGNEISEFPLGNREHNVVKQNGEWLVCGY